jgi:predicted N-acetyltransferase YhbS
MPKMLPLASCDPAAVENLLDAAFGSDRRGRTAYLLREGMEAIAALSFGLTDGGEIIGTIQCWPVLVGDDGAEAAPLVLVGPVAVAPHRQKEGFGIALMEAMLEAALLEGNPPMVMIGDAEFYGRFGFSAEKTGGWKLPGPYEPHRLLLRNDGDYPLPISGMIGPDNRE